MNIRSLCSAFFFVCLAGLYPTASAQTISWSGISAPAGGSLFNLTTDRQGNIFAATMRGIYRSTDRGVSWVPLGFSFINGTTVLSSDSSDNIYTAYISEGIYKSSDHGITWSKLNVEGKIYSAKIISGNRVFVGGIQTVSISNDGGQTWSVTSATPVISPILSVAEDTSGYLYAGTQHFIPKSDPPYGGGVYISKDSGKSWSYDGDTLTSIFSMAVNRKTGRVFIQSEGGIQSSAPGDHNWIQDGKGFPITVTVLYLSNDRAGHVIAVADGGVFQYEDSSGTWKSILPAVSSAAIVAETDGPDGVHYVGTDRNGVFAFDTSSSSWYQCGVYPVPVRALALNGANELYAGTDDGMYVRRNNGKGWQRWSNSLARDIVFRLYYSPVEDKIFASTGSGLFSLAKDASSWVALTKEWVYDFVRTQAGDGYAGSTGGILMAHAGDDLWRSVQSVGLPKTRVYALALDSSKNLYAGTRNAGVFKSTDGGSFWQQTGITSSLIFYSVNTVMFDRNGRMFAGTDSAGAYFSDDSATHWNPIPSLAADNITSFLFKSSSEYIAGTYDQGVFISTDRGINWSPENSGLTDMNVTCLLLNSGGSLYAGSDSGIFQGMFTPTGVHTMNDAPFSFALMQNYPNPFNPTTDIEYQISSVTHVSLKVFDLIGREMATLVDEVQSPGNYTVRFTASAFSSGVYFYRLQAGNFIVTKKMVFSK